MKGQRPCHRRHSELRPDDCPTCELIATNASYAAYYGYPPPANPVARPRRKKRPPAPLPCIHLGKPTGETIPCKACGGKRTELKVFACDIYATCTIGKRVPDVAGCCKGCKQKELPPAINRDAPATGPAVGRRHLVYHLLPVAGDAWRRNVDELRARWPMFTGRKVVAIMTGESIVPQGRQSRPLPLEPPDVVRAYLPADCEVLEIPNDPQRWELASWPHLWARVLEGIDDNDAVLYAHAKGVTRPANTTTHAWAELLYALSLDHWDRVEDQLRRYPIAGPLLKIGRFFAAANHDAAPAMRRSRWHYSGNFWWVRASAIRAALAATPVPVDRWGAEAWPGIAFPVNQAGSIWSPAVEYFDLYKVEQFNAITSAFEKWQEGRPARTAWIPRSWDRPAVPYAGEPRLSVIVPTNGRGSLAAAKASIESQLAAGDELLVEEDQSGDWGMTPRTRAMERAKGTHLLFLDDDDVYLPGALAAVRSAIAAAPDRVHLFRLRRGEPFHDTIGVVPQVSAGNVSTQSLVVPNDPARLGFWGRRYEGDFDFLVSTLKHYPDGPIWHAETLAYWRAECDPDAFGPWTHREWYVDRRHARWIFEELCTGRHKRVLEIGSYHGYSTTAFLSALRIGLIDELHLCEPDVRPELEAILAKFADVGDRVTVHRSKSIELLERDCRWDLVFVDGDHSAETVSAEARLLLAAGVATVFAHDTSDPGCPGPKLLHAAFRDSGYNCVEDAVDRPGELTRRGMLLATKPRAAGGV